MSGITLLHARTEVVETWDMSIALTGPTYGNISNSNRWNIYRQAMEQI